VQSGRSALQALEEAKRQAQRGQWMNRSRSADAEQKVDEARKRLEPEVRWAEQALEKLRKKAAERAAGKLSERGDDEERMAQRAGELRKRGQGQGALPQPALEALEGAEQSAHEAARSLKQGDADRALQAQRDAQRQLEQATEALGSGDRGEGGHGEGDERFDPTDHTDIPKADQHKGPEEFRRRVLRGLGQQASGRQKEAVRRYAEGLLR
jgi:hypothetical protein